MKMYSTILILILCLFGIVQTAQAAPVTVTLTAVKDCEVRATAPDTAFPSDPNLQPLKTETLSNNKGMLAQFELPADCEAANITELKWKNVVCATASGSHAQYIVGIFQAAEDAAGDLNAYTWNTAPGVNTSLTPTDTINYDSADGRYCVYGGYTATVGAETSFTINASGNATYWGNTQTVLGQDTDGILTFYYHERYRNADCPRFASIENGSYHGPQLEITYEPTAVSTEVTVTLTATRDVQTYKAFPDTAYPYETEMYHAKQDPNHAAFWWEFKFPSDCDPSTISAAVYKNTIAVPRASGSTAAYLCVIKDAYEGNLDDYTWNTGPGLDQNQTGDGLKIDGTEANYAGYGGYPNTAGAVWEYDPQTNASYWNSLKTNGFDADTNGRIQFMWHERYAGIGPSIASIENTTYTGPQLTITYPPQLIQKGILIDDDYLPNAEEEGPVAVTYDVSLTLEPSAGVTVTLDYDTDVVSVSPSVLSFSTSDWDTPQTVTVTPVDDAIAYEPVYQTEITHTAASADLDYQFAPIETATISIEDNDYKTVVLTAIADNDVNSVYPDSSGFAEPNMAPMRSDGPVNYRYSYVQFELPADFAYALSGTQFKLTRSYISPSPQYLYLMGVRNENLTTGEPIPEGDVNAYTWNTAPGLELVPNPGSAGGLSGFEADEAYFIANTLPSAAGSPGDEEYFNTYSLDEAMARFINYDKGDDNKITLFIIPRMLQTDVDKFGCLEDPTYDAAQIELVYGATPYCGQPGPGFSPVDFDEDCDVDIDDLQTMAGKWLDDSVE